MAYDADLTLEGALRDPMIAAVMRADHVDPRAFETLLRGARLRLGTDDRLPRVPMAIAAGCRGHAVRCGRPA